MMQTQMSSVDLKVLMNHIYEYEKGVRQMVLYTFNGKYEKAVVDRLRREGIDFVAQHISNGNINLFFGRKACIDAIRLFVKRPLYELTPEEDFILGALLGYDINMQCERYCKRKGGKCEHCMRAQG
ncbi:MAG: DUF2023 family protein [Prevotella sp.]